MSPVRTVRVERKWILTEVMKKDRQLVEAAGLDITPKRWILQINSELEASSAVAKLLKMQDNHIRHRGSELQAFNLPSAKLGYPSRQVFLPLLNLLHLC